MSTTIELCKPINLIVYFKYALKKHGFTDYHLYVPPWDVKNRAHYIIFPMEEDAVLFALKGIDVQHHVMFDDYT